MRPIASGSTWPLGQKIGSRKFHSWRAFSSSSLYSFILTTNGSNIVWMLFTFDQLILPAFDHSQHSQTQRAPLLRQQQLWNLFVRDRILLRQPMRLIVPSYLGIIHAIILWKSHILHPPPILKDIKQQTMWIIGCGLFVRNPTKAYGLGRNFR